VAMVVALEDEAARRRRPTNSNLKEVGWPNWIGRLYTGIFLYISGSVLTRNHKTMNRSNGINQDIRLKN